MLTKEPETGHRIAHFQILERLGSGGMGVVYKAQDLKLGRFVALKFMAPERERSEDARLRFLREARALSVLDHPNVCTLYEVGETEGGQLFLAMALCQGETLRSRLRQGPLEPGEAVRIAIQIADGLSAAHARGVVHRDIKPGNILIGDGQVRIVDFGVARLADQTPLTREGLAVGTVQYTAPEQLFGGDVGPAADLWSLGVVLYELLAGRPPFPGNSVPEAIVSILKGTPPKLQGVAPELWRTLRKALTKAPQLRYRSAEEMRADLLAVAEAGSDTQSLQVPAWLATAATITEANLLQNLPFPPLGELLKGRSEDLRALEEALEEAGSTGIRSHVIHGLGGIGKTRLAVEHAWACGSRYRAVLFVLADSPEGLNSGLAALARNDLLDLPERDAPAESEVTGAVLRWLRENPGWLLILDNADTREAQLAVTRLLSALAGGQVLITSRRRDWPAGVERQSLDVIPLAAATDFLIQRTARDRRREPDDVAHALRLAELLDGLPLALEQAAAYISHTQMSIAEYLEVWESECDSVLRWYDEGVMQYPASLAITWQKSFRELTPTAKALLQLISWLAADPIPVAMLESGEALREAARQLDPGQEIPVRPVREDIAELAALSLIGRQGATITVHPIVQEVIRSRIPEESRTAWCESTLTILSHFAPFQADETTTWPVWDLLRPHVIQALGHATEQGIAETLVASKLMGCLAVLCYAKSLYAEAEPLWRKVLEIDERLLGENHPETAMNLSNLAMLLKSNGRPDEAEPLARRALEIDRAAFGEEHPLVARDLSCVALLLLERGQWSEAEELSRKALLIDQACLGENHLAVARDLHNLAMLLMATERSAEAEPLIRRAVEINKEMRGADHPKVARNLQILAGILRGQGRLAEAEPISRQALELFEQSLGPDHLSTRSARQDLESLKHGIS